MFMLALISSGVKNTYLLVFQRLLRALHRISSPLVAQHHPANDV